MDMPEEQVLENKDWDLNEGVYIMIDIREEQWRYVPDNFKYRSSIHALGWGVYTKDNDELMKRLFWWKVHI